MNIKERLTLWLNAIKDPKKTFAAQKRKADFKEGAINIVIGGLIAGIIAGIYTGALVSGAVGGIVGGLIGWIIAGGIYFIFAKLLGGKGDFITQIYLMSLYIPIISIIAAIFSPVSSVTILISLLGLYFLTFALKEAHGYSTGKAILTWFIPIIILLVIVVILVMVAVALFAPLIGTMVPELGNFAEFLPVA